MPATVKSRGRKEPLVSNKKAKVDKAQDRAIKIIRDIVLADKKYFHENLPATGVISSGAIAAFTMPSQGDSVVARDGDTVKWLGLNGSHESVCGDATNILRFVIFQWKPDNSVESPSLAKIFQTSNVADSVFILEQKSRNKFKVLYDSTHVMSLNGDAIKRGRIRVPASKMLNTYFTQSATTGNNVIYYVTLSDSVGAPNPSLQFNLAGMFES